jgi:cytochrome P450
MLTLRRHAQVSAVLAAPGFQVVSAAPGESGLAWLRGAVSRFSTGETHQRRRALVTAALPDPAGLRAAAGKAAAVVLDGTLPTDGGTSVARRVPVEVLAGELGFAGPVAGAVAAVAALYLTGPDGADPAVRAAADAGVAELVAGADAGEATAAGIAVLVQAHDATAGLVAAGLHELARHQPSATVPDVLAETLRYAPPVPVQRRVCVRDTLVGTVPVAAGTPVVLDIAAANRDPDVFADPDRFAPGRPDADRHLTFGSGLRPCPGDRQALALAAGVLDALLETVCARQTAEPLWVATAAALLAAREEQ